VYQVADTVDQAVDDMRHDWRRETLERWVNDTAEPLSRPQAAAADLARPNDAGRTDAAALRRRVETNAERSCL
jgi:hypothetical protein